MDDRDKILNIIKYWQKIEHFSPFQPKDTLSSDQQRYYIQTNDDFPWRKKCKLKRMYKVYMGNFFIQGTMQTLEKYWGKNEEWPEDDFSTSCICMFHLDDELNYENYSFRVSALPWAVGKVIKGEFEPDTWSQEFDYFQEMMLGAIYDHIGKWNMQSFEEMKEVLLQAFDWDIPLHDAWLYIDEIRLKEKEENNGTNSDKEEEQEEEFDVEEEKLRKNELLNSFYVRDLERVQEAVEAGNFGKGLYNYINGWVKGNTRVDIESNIESLKSVLAPENIPLGRWPSHNNLSLMQQAAVNLAKSDYTDNKGLFSVNGPPGTGKTTLLRDIIASVIVDRAVLLSKLNKPGDAFVEGNTISLKKDGFPIKLFQLKEEFRDFGMVVASNNNGAVQNISKELPGIHAIPGKYKQHKDYDYFFEQANYIFKDDCWSLISATLGNRRNCKKFANKFWDTMTEVDKNRSMKWLLYNSRAEKPDWDKAVKKFNERYKLVVSERDHLMAFERALHIKKEMELRYRYENEQLASLNAALDRDQLALERAEKDKRAAAERLGNINALLKNYEDSLKGIWKKLFPSAEVKREQSEWGKIKEEQRTALKDAIACGDAYGAISRSREEKEKRHRGIEEEIGRIKKETEKADDLLKQAKAELEANFPDDAYWKDFDNNEAAQINCPWAYIKLNELREELFLEALNLHRVFIMNSYEMKQNLNLFFNLVNKNLNYEDEKAYTNDIFQSLFLAVPVISTTFASVARLFRHIGREEIGWLLIDEAGQGTPQSAAGLIWRARRTVAVGDPLQIEPVITISQNVYNRLGEYYKIDTKYVSRELSVQTMADEANRYGTYRAFPGKDLWIGCPLRVHRRCINPMFQISNRIAYNNKMICATSEPKGREFVVETSLWKSIQGITNTPHYIKEQGEYIYQLISGAIRKGNGTLPSIFVITPFVTVKDALRRLFLDHDRFYSEIAEFFPEAKKAMVNNWISSSIGTVHTFQGKEADTVIFCLGVDSREQGHGALKWASEKPNLLNVAASRARYRFLVVGDERLWMHQRYFMDAYKLLSPQSGSSNINKVQ